MSESETPAPAPAEKPNPKKSLLPCPYPQCCPFSSRAHGFKCPAVTVAERDDEKKPVAFGCLFCMGATRE